MQGIHKSEELLFVVGQLDRLEGYYLNYLFEKRGYPLTREQWTIIKILWDKNGVAQQDLANELLKNKASITSLIENLEKKGLILRKTNLYDKRSKMVFLTDEGRRIREEVHTFVQETTNDLTRNVSEIDIQNTRQVLSKILDNLVFLKKKSLEAVH